MSDSAAIVAARLAELWRKSLPTTLERVAALRSACETLGRNPADAEARSAGREAAHKLSGSLGVFGLPRGTEVAAAMEEVLRSAEPLTPEAVELLARQTRKLEAVIASKQS
jgi:HPt (histidine-containing phosphotransfer) domain-containing protein